MRISKLNKKQKILVVTVITSVILLIFIVVLLILLSQRNNQSESLDSDLYPISATVSSPVSNQINEQSSESVIEDESSFELSEISMNPNLQTHSYKFNLNIPELYKIEKINNGIRITNYGFVLEIISTAEAFGGLYEYIPENIDLNSLEFGKVTRILDRNQNLVSDRFTSDLNFQYFYTNTFSKEENCNVDKATLGYVEVSCIDNLSINFKTLDIGIYCAVDQEVDVRICDEIISSIEEDDTYKIGYVYLNSGEPSGEKLELDLNLDEYFIKSYESYSSLSLSNGKIEISFIAPSEGTGGIRDFIPENIFIINDIFRVRLDSLFEVTDFPNKNGQKYSRYYYYTDSFKTGSECSQFSGSNVSDQSSCGDTSIQIDQISRPIKVYCAVNNESDVNVCDEIVKTMKVGLSNDK